MNTDFTEGNEANGELTEKFGDRKMGGGIGWQENLVAERLGIGHEIRPASRDPCLFPISGSVVTFCVLCVLLRQNCSDGICFPFFCQFSPLGSYIFGDENEP
jgi:hypothetical protein